MTFPSLTPSARTFVPGGVPLVQKQTLSGSVSGFRRGNRRINQTLQLSYQNLTEAQVTEIRNHFDDRQGTFKTFYLSNETWAGYDSPPVPLLSDNIWRYVNPPIISDGFTSRWNIEIELESVPIDLGDVIFSGEAAAASPARTYILDGGAASATPARDYIVNGGNSA